MERSLTDENTSRVLFQIDTDDMGKMLVNILNLRIKLENFNEVKLLDYYKGESEEWKASIFSVRFEGETKLYTSVDDIIIQLLNVYRDIFDQKINKLHKEDPIIVMDELEILNFPDTHDIVPNACPRCKTDSDIFSGIHSMEYHEPVISTPGNLMASRHVGRCPHDIIIWNRWEKYDIIESE